MPLGGMDPAQPLSAIMQSIPEVKAMLVCDHEGVIILRGGDEAEEGSLQRMSAMFAQTNEQANKLGLGRSKHMVTFRDNAVVLHASLAPLVVTLMASADANVGLLLEALPRLLQALEPMQQAVESIANAHS